MLIVTYVQNDKDSVNITGDYTGTVGRFSEMWQTLEIDAIEESGAILEYIEPVEPIVVPEPEPIPEPVPELTVAWFDASKYSVRVIGVSKLITPYDKRWKSLGLQAYVDTGLVLDYDFDKVIPPEPTEEELLAKAEAEAKQTKVTALKELVVTTTKGNTFDGNTDSLLNMLSAIEASALLGQESSYWKLADNTVVLVEMSELKEAHALAIEARGAIILG